MMDEPYVTQLEMTRRLQTKGLPGLKALRTRGRRHLHRCFGLGAQSHRETHLWR